MDRQNFDAMSLAVSRANPGQMYLAGHNIFQQSSDGGASWQPVAHNLPGTDIHGFAIAPDNADRLTAFIVGFGVLKSTDSGKTWARPAGQLPSDVTAIASAGGSPETLYVSSARSGLVRSAHCGSTWTSMVGSAGNGPVFSLAVDPAAAQTVYSSGEAGIVRSTDGGATWTNSRSRAAMSWRWR